MPRSSRHKSSHKQSKHSLKDSKECSDSEANDVKMKGRNNSNSKEESSVRVSRDLDRLSLGEKRKLGRESKEVVKEAKDLTSHGNVNGDEEYVSSKRRKEKAADGGNSGGDRWNGCGGEKGEGGVVFKKKELRGESSRNDSGRGLKLKELKVVSVDSKSKSSRRTYESGREKEKEEENVGSTMKKEESIYKKDLNRKSERDSVRKEGYQYKDLKDAKDKERGSEKGKKGEDRKQHDGEVNTGNGEVAKKQGGSQLDLGEDRKNRRGRENAEWPIQDELQNSELEKEHEKRIQRRIDGSSDKDKNQDDLGGNVDKRSSSRGDRSKDGRYKDERHKDGKYHEDGEKGSKQGDFKSREDSGRDIKYRDDKYHEDGEKESKHRDFKYREDSGIDIKHRDDKYHEDGEKENKHGDFKCREDGGRDIKQRDNKYREDGNIDYRCRDDKYREDGERDNRRRDEKYLEDGDRDNRRREDKYRKDGDTENRQRDDKYHEDGDRDNKHRDNKYRDDGVRDSRLIDRSCEDGEKDGQRDGKYREDGNRDYRHKKEKHHRENVERASRYRDVKLGDDIDREKRLRDVKFRDERGSREHTGDKSDIKHSDESNTVDVYHRKSSLRDGSPSYDDRATRYKDDHGRRRANDKEDHGDLRSRSTKEERPDSEKRSISGSKVDLVTDRGRSNTRNADVEINPTYSRRRSSPTSSSHAARDHDRLSKQDESKYRDYAYEERVWHSVTSGGEYASVAGVTDKISSWSVEKSIQKDDGHFSQLSAERRLKSDARTSPIHMVDKSPSSTSAGRTHLNRFDVRRSLDVGELGQRSGGSKDAKDYSGKEGRESHEFPMEMLPGDDDGDNLSVSSSFTRNVQFYSNSKSLLRPPPPPPPYRTGIESPLIFGSSEDDNRGKSISHHRRIGDHYLGRAHGSPWKGVPNWPSPVADGFMPFQHGPPAVSFHPVMQQFPAPPIFSVRPSMELNHTGVPYHIPDSDRFSGPGRPLGGPPPLHVWDANNAVFGDESRIYGSWEHSRTQMSSRGWETSRNSGPSAELPSAYQEKYHAVHGPANDGWAIQSIRQAQNEQNQQDLRAEIIDISQSSDALEKNTPEPPDTISEEIPDMSKMSRKDDTRIFHVYLSKLDISSDLAQPELYNQCTTLMDLDPTNTIPNGDDSKILDAQKFLEAKVRFLTNTSSISLFAAINNSVFEKAMFLYKRQREESGVINGEKISFATMEDLDLIQKSDHERMDSNDGKPGEQTLACDPQEVEHTLPNFSEDKAELPISSQNLKAVPASAYQKLDEPVVADTLDKSENPISNLNKVTMEVDLVSDQQLSEYIVEDKAPSLENVERSDALSPSRIEDTNKSIISEGNHHAINYTEQNLVDKTCLPLLFSDASSEACEAVMLESIESGSVNLSRIHHSPQSTH